MMAGPDRTFTFEASIRRARYADGLIAAVRVYHPKWVNLWLWLEDDRETLSELKSYCVGMLGGEIKPA